MRSMSIRIAIVGDFHPEYQSHLALNAAIPNVARRLPMDVHTDWIPTEKVAEAGPENVLRGFDAVVAAPGGPYRSFHGMLQAIEFARVRKVPFTGS